MSVGGSTRGGIQFGGLVSGLPVNDIITSLINAERTPINIMEAKVQSLRDNDFQFKAIQNMFSRLQTSVNKLVPTSILDTNLFQEKQATSSSASTATATVTTEASPQSFSLEVTQLATPTKAKTINSVGQWITGTNTINQAAQGAITNGTMTLFVNGVANTLTVDNTQTMDTLLTAIGGITGVDTATLTNGVLTVTANAGNALTFGANGDTSNFLDVSGMKTGTTVGLNTTGSTALSATDINADVSSVAANLVTPVVDGTFTIGTATIDTTGKSLSDIIYAINTESGTGVTAFYDRNTNKVNLTSKGTGSTLITMANGTSNFLTSMGLITGLDSATSQTAGQNASFKINGTTLLSASNTVQSTVSGLTGVTMNLLATNTGSPLTMTVSQKTDTLTTAAQEFVTQFNSIISAIDSQTKLDSTSAKLKSESGLRNIRNQIRNVLTERNTDNDEYTSLSQIGISTGAVNANATGSATATYSLDTTKLAEALADNPQEVQELIMGTNGILRKLKTVVDDSLEASTETNGAGGGIFPSHADAISRQIKILNDQILKANDRLLQKETAYRKQFTQMESLISQYRQQGTALAGFANQQQ